METMELKTNQNQIVIKTKPENERQKLPVNLIMSLAAGTIAGELRESFPILGPGKYTK